MAETKIIVLDDDPTGSQTVHSCLLLTRWDVETLKQGLQDAAPLFFVLNFTTLFFKDLSPVLLSVKALSTLSKTLPNWIMPS